MIRFNNIELTVLWICKNMLVKLVCKLSSVESVCVTNAANGERGRTRQVSLRATTY